MKRCRAGGEEEGEEVQEEEEESAAVEGAAKRRSQQLMKAVCLQCQSLSVEGGVVDFSRGGAEPHGWRGRWREASAVWRPAQRMGSADLAVPGLAVRLATSADMERHGGRGGFRRAKQPKGSTKEGTSLCGEGGKSVSGAGLSTHTHTHTLAFIRTASFKHVPQSFSCTSSLTAAQPLTETARLSAGKSNQTPYR